MSSSAGMPEIKVEKDNLYREENYTDTKAFNVRKLVPVKVDGTVDEARKPMFIGSAQVMSQMGPIPINCPIEAENIEEAMEKFPAAVEGAIQKMIEEVKEMQRQEANRIVVPEGGAGMGNSKIQL